MRTPEQSNTNPEVNEINFAAPIEEVKMRTHFHTSNSARNKYFSGTLDNALSWILDGRTSNLPKVKEEWSEEDLSLTFWFDQILAAEKNWFDTTSYIKKLRNRRERLLWFADIRIQSLQKAFKDKEWNEEQYKTALASTKESLDLLVFLEIFTEEDRENILVQIS